MFRNFKGVFTDIFNISKTIFSNIVTNIKRVFTGIWAWIKSGGRRGFEDGFVGLTEGVKSSIDEKLVLDKFVPPELKTEARKRFRDAFKEWNKAKDTTASKEAAKGFDTLVADPAAVAKQKEAEAKKKKKKKGVSDVGSFKGLQSVWRDLQTSLLKEEDKVAKKQLGEAQKGNKLLQAIHNKLGGPQVAVLA